MDRLFQITAPYFALFSFILLVTSVYKRNDWTDTLTPLPQLQREPAQQPNNQAAFIADYNNETYEVIPKYDYELFGLVVSYRLHDATGNTMIHDLTKDHLNVADLCVVWGQSADTNILKHITFRSGQFTCFLSSKKRGIWDQFNLNQLSNNHLLALNDDIRSTIKDVKIGDQIHIKGWLSHYINPLGGERGTSTVRTDRGNGACETLYVNDITIIKSMTSHWRHLIWLSLLSLLAALWTVYHTPIEASQFKKSDKR